MGCELLRPGESRFEKSKVTNAGRTAVCGELHLVTREQHVDLSHVTSLGEFVQSGAPTLHDSTRGIQLSLELRIVRRQSVPLGGFSQEHCIARADMESKQRLFWQHETNGFAYFGEAQQLYHRSLVLST